MSNLFIACDHAAFREKEKLMEYCQKWCNEHDGTLFDLGTKSEDSVHYPEYAIKLCEQLLKSGDKADRGILLCGSGIGMSIAANKFKGVRAALCRNVEDAKLSRQHNDANVLCLGARSTSLDEIFDILKVWLETEHEGGRHQIRVDMLNKLGSNC